MTVHCVWEHNGGDTLLYAVELPGAFARGDNVETALEKMRQEVRGFLAWQGVFAPLDVELEIVQEADCVLNVRDADSDVLFDAEKAPLTLQEYTQFKALALKSAADFHALYTAIPDKAATAQPPRKTFYGAVPRSACEMYIHTKNVNDYYFGEIGVAADNEGTILECRSRGFAALEQQPDFLQNTVFDGSYGELWSLRKLLRRFIWHDRIHAKAMYRMVRRVFGPDAVPDVFCFGESYHANDM